jgi:ribosomal protein L11 methyltransferase
LKWLEVSISLSSELAESISDLLARHAPGGVVLETLSTRPNNTYVNEVIVRAYLPVDDHTESKKKAIQEGLWHLSQIKPLPPAQFRSIEEQEWDKVWKEHYNPIAIGKRLIIQPVWIPLGETDRLPILMDPGMAFGTGTHPTTQLCLMAIEDHLQKGDTFIDIGCGSGILSIAAALLGAGSVLALDIDSVALQNARKNIQQNDVNHIITVKQGSLEHLLEETPSTRVPSDLVAANIITKTLDEMIRSGLGKIITAYGSLILSGILDHQVETIQSACTETNLEIVETLSMDDWRALIVKRIPPLH